MLREIQPYLDEMKSRLQCGRFQFSWPVDKLALFLYTVCTARSRCMEGMHVRKQIGRYEIRRELGRGGMATVFLAFDPRFRRQVAVKVLPRQFTHDPKYLARFEQEAHTIAKLEHAAIVPVYDFGDHEDAPFLVMRFMPGGTLRHRLQGDPVPLGIIAPALTRLAPALDKAHSLSIIHRDLKPANILFDDEGNSYLADFGIARLAEASQTMTVVGTPSYMSPEQVQGDLELDGRADVYALGVILYELFTGVQPFEANTPTKQMMAHVLEPIPDVMAANPALPLGAQHIIDKSMAKDREERYSTASELAKAVSSLIPADQTLDPAAAAAAAAAAFSNPAILPTQSDKAAEPIELAPAGSAASEPALEEPTKSRSEDLVAVAAASSLAQAGSSVTPPPVPPAGDVIVPSDDSAAGGGLPGWLWWVVALAFLAVVAVTIGTVLSGVNRDDDGDSNDIAELEPGNRLVTGELEDEVTSTPTVEPAQVVGEADPDPGESVIGSGEESTEGAEIVQSSETPKPSETPIPPTETPIPTDMPTTTATATQVPTILPDTPTPTSTSLPPTETPISPTPTPNQPHGRIAYVSNQNGPDSVFVMDAENPSDTYQLTYPASGGYDWWPDWCGDNEIVFERVDDVGDPNWQEIYTVDLDTGNVDSLTSTSNSTDYSGFNGVPRCSQDGRNVVVSRSHEISGKLIWLAGVIDRTTNSYSTIHNGRYKAGHASWSPDGQSVVLMQFPEPGTSNFNIFRIQLADSSSYLNLTRGRGFNSKYPDWSPVNDEIAFACGEDVNSVWSLCIAGATNGGVEVLHPRLGFGSERESRSGDESGHFITPSWSPDGQYIAFATNALNDNWEIYVYEINTGQVSNLTNTPRIDEMHPRWEP
jgi:serine/threonine protein kinase/Tol biopolymer transport system component